MGKIPLRLEIKSKKKQDIEFRFSDVQTKNPRLQGKTPTALYVEDFKKSHEAKRKWWEK